MNSNVPLDAIPVWVWVVVGVLVAIQLTIEIWALVDMLRRPADQLTLGGRKWLWAIIILAVNLFGAIVYLVAGRKPVPTGETTSSVPAGERGERAVDVLYGDAKDGGPQ